MSYETQSIWEASFLMANGCKLAGRKKSGNKVSIMFKDENASILAVSFYNNALVKAKDFADNYRTLKDYIFQRKEVE